MPTKSFDSHSVSIVLMLPDGSAVFQRRDGNALTSKHRLGWFGGGVDDGETAEQAARREIAEETSLNADTLVFEHVIFFEFAPSEYNNKSTRFDIFICKIKNDKFEVYEGSGKEVYLPQNCMNMPDLTPSARLAVAYLNRGKGVST